MSLTSHVRRNAVAYLALFVALAGTSYAATRLPKGSVGPKQIKKNAVTAKKIADGAIIAAKLGDGSVGSRALQDGSVGAADLAPGAGLPDQLPSGRTLRGYWGIRASTDANGLYLGDSISFPIPLGAAPEGDFVPQAGSDPDCPGSVSNPQAAPGHLCVYEGFTYHLDFHAILTAGGTEGTTRFGARVDYFAVDGAGPTNAAGTWAVTAP
jgi:hypothetical protein